MTSEATQRSSRVPEENDNPERKIVPCAWWLADRALAREAGCDRTTTNATGICSPCWRAIP